MRSQSWPRLFRDILLSFGYDVEIAHDGLKAIGRVKIKAFDIELMDVRDQRRGSPARVEMRPEVAVIMMTIYSVEGLISEALEKGAYGVLFKPFDVRRMLELITKIEATAASTR